MIDFSNLFGGQTAVFNGFFKGFAVVGSFMYFVYALVLLRQVNVMIRTIEEAHPFLFRILAIVQLIFAFLLIVLSFTLL